MFILAPKEHRKQDKVNTMVMYTLQCSSALNYLHLEHIQTRWIMKKYIWFTNIKCRLCTCKTYLSQKVINFIQKFNSRLWTLSLVNLEKAKTLLAKCNHLKVTVVHMNAKAMQHCKIFFQCMHKLTFCFSSFIHWSLFQL